MNARFTVALILSCSTFAVTAGALPQSPASGDPQKPSAVATTPLTKPINLKVLPKDISADDVDKLMHRFERDLGVPCGYCHEENTQTKQIDFASDENPIKETARFIIKMNADINMKYLAQLGDRRYAQPITCGNCHQGQTNPPAFEPKPQR
jgi:hypothetical protein